MPEPERKKKLCYECCATQLNYSLMKVFNGSSRSLDNRDIFWRKVVAVRAVQFILTVLKPITHMLCPRAFIIFLHFMDVASHS